MTVSVRLAKDVVAEFLTVADAVEFIKMLGLATEAASASRVTLDRPETKRSAPSLAFVPRRTEVVRAAEPAVSGVGLATDATLAQLQSRSDVAVAAGCRAA